MKHKKINPLNMKLIDLVPALSGLIGKTALATSFAVVWAVELNIANPDFVFENVRIEMMIGSIITLIAALLFTDIAPSGTLAPLVVLVPTMAAFGVHPFVLSITVGIIGILGIRTRLFHKLVKLSGEVSKTGITLTFGISGIIMSVKNLITYFTDNNIPLLLILVSLSVIYLLLMKLNATWLIIPSAAVISILFSVLYGRSPGTVDRIAIPSFNPSFWWNDMWGIGFGFHLTTILKTVPFAFFVIILWAIDTLSITTMLDANYKPGEAKETINLNSSFIIASIRNMVGGSLGGAQTSALWRSFLIPLFMVKRPLRPASILLGFLGIIAGFSAVPIKILSFPPLIWSVLLFGIFLPFTVVGLKNLSYKKTKLDTAAILTASLIGVFVTPILTWVITIIFEKVFDNINLKKYKA